jgi:hypothetical protein
MKPDQLSSDGRQVELEALGLAGRADLSKEAVASRSSRSRPSWSPLWRDGRVH